MDVETYNTDKSIVKAWISAMRLRTLPLALASTFTGAFLAMQYVVLDGLILLLTALTTILLQVNSNLANDYGDFSHGTDNEERIGPMRAMQSGAITKKAMRRGIGIASLLSLVSGVALLWLAPLELWLKLVLFVMGVLAIVASITYTAGSNPYGYRGLGDVSVMAFFGILGVAGSFLCQVGALHWDVLLAAFSVGGFSAGVLNINNTRDIESDTNAGKITLAVRLGPSKARRYHAFLIAGSMLLFLIYGAMHFPLGWSWSFLLAYPLFVLNLWQVSSNKDPRKLDPKLKQLALSTFFFALMLGLGLGLA